MTVVNPFNATDMSLLSYNNIPRTTFRYKEGFEIGYLGKMFQKSSRSTFSMVVKRKSKVDNSTNINKTNNHLSPQIIEQKERPLHMTLIIQTGRGL